MSKQNVLPNLVTYNALLQSAAVHSGEIGRQLFLQCNLPEVRTLRACGSSKIDLHDLSEGTALLALRYWLSNAVARDLESSDPLTCIIITGYGKSRKDWDTTDVRQAVLSFFQRLGLKPSPLPENPGRLRLVVTKRNLPVLRCAVGKIVRLADLFPRSGFLLPSVHSWC